MLNTQINNTRTNVNFKKLLFFQSLSKLDKIYFELTYLMGLDAKCFEVTDLKHLYTVTVDSKSLMVICC